MPHIYYRHTWASGPSKYWQTIQITNEKLNNLVKMPYDDMHNLLVFDENVIPDHDTYYSNDAYRGVEISLTNPAVNQNKLILLRGLPGSGKSTLAKWLSEVMQSCVYYEADTHHVNDAGIYKFDPKNLGAAHAKCILNVEIAMRDFNYETIIVSNTLTENWELNPYEQLAQSYNYQVVSLIVENRHGNKSIYGVPIESMIAMRKRFQVNL